MKTLICLLAILITTQTGGRVITTTSQGTTVYKNVKINGTLTVRPAATVR